MYKYKLKYFAQEVQKYSMYILCNFILKFLIYMYIIFNSIFLLLLNYKVLKAYRMLNNWAT